MLFSRIFDFYYYGQLDGMRKPVKPGQPMAIRSSLADLAKYDPIESQRALDINS